MSLRLHTLGRFSLERDGAPQPERAGQPVRAALLVLLALDREVTREAAMALLWPESDDEHARQALRQTLYLLRRDLGDDWLDASPEALRATAALDADAVELVRAADAGEDGRVVSLYAGAFLAGARLAASHPFQLWCDQWAGRLERLHRRARRSLIEARVAAGDAAGALAVARAWLELDPLEDEARHRVIELLHRLGRGDDALREYDAFADLLAREGLRPLDETRALAKRIRAGGPGLPALPDARDAPAPEAAEPGPPGARGSAGAPGSAGFRGSTGGPRRRRRSRARAVVALALVLAAAALVPLVRGGAGGGDGGPASAPDPARVMVLPLVNETGDSALDGVGLLVADWITDGLAHMGTLRAVPFADVRQMVRAGVGPVRVASYRQVGTLVSGRYFRAGAGDSLELHVRITDARDGELWHALAPVRLDPATPAAGLRALRDRVAGSLGVRVTPASALPDPAALEPPSYPAFRALMDAAEYIARQDWAGALPHLRRAVALDPTFDRARLGLVSAYRNIGQPARADSLLRTLASRRDGFSPYERVVYRGIRAELDGDIGRQLDAARDGVGIDPGGTVHYIAASIALAAGRPREALELQAGLDLHCPWAPAWLGPWRYRTGALHLLGRHHQELDDARRARARHPDRPGARWLEVRALTALGDTAAVRARLRDADALAPEDDGSPGDVRRATAAELRAHSHPAAAATTLAAALAWYRDRPPEEQSAAGYRRGRLDALLDAGRLDDAAAVLAGLRRDDPDALDLLGLAGLLAARRGDTVRARLVDDSLQARRGPYQDGAVDYWRAAMAAWAGAPERALSLLRRAFAQGRPRGIALHADPRLEPLWPLPAFQAAVAEPD